MISIIAAISTNYALGKDNELLWHLPDDFKRFKRVTSGHHVIMGRKTFESLGKKALPKRTNIVITRQEDYDARCVVLARSLSGALQIAETDTNTYILGGGTIYKEAIKIADRLDITLVHENFEADTFFPPINPEIWREVSRTFHPKDAEHAYDFSYVIYERKALE